MKFTSNTQDFLTACSKAARATGKKQFETSDMLLIEAHGPYGIATGYDLTLGISAPFGIAPGDDGKIAIDAKILCGILKKAPSETVSFETTGDDVTIRAGRSRFTLKGVSADSFPQIPEIEGDSITFYDGCKHFKDKSHFIELPCKVGGTVYLVGATQVFDCTVNEINIKIIDEMSFSVFLSAEYVSENYGKCYTTFDWTEKKGKTVFLTREKAERELKERENNV